jgi:hypothetical protein
MRRRSRQWAARLGSVAAGSSAQRYHGVMRVRHVHGRAEVGHERLQLSERERIVERRELRRGMRLRDKGENGGRFRQTPRSVTSEGTRACGLISR